MDIKETIELALDALKDRKVRSILTILMVVVGSSLIVSLNGMSAGFSQFTEKQFKALAPNVLLVSSAQQLGRIGGGGGGALGEGGTRVILTPVVINNITHLPGVEDVIPDYTGAITLQGGGKTTTVRVLALDMQWIFTLVPTVQFDEGSVLTSTDTSAIVLAENVARPPAEDFAFATVGEALQAKYTYTDTNGNQITNTRSFVVKAIMKQTGSPMVDNAIIILPSVANSLMNKGNRYDGMIVAAESADLVDQVQSEIKKVYGNNIGINTPQTTLATIQQFRSGITDFMLGIAVVSLLVGAIGIITTLYTSVMERIREIGTMKAIGAQSKEILSLFLSEALIIGMIGASIGIIVGMGGGFLLTDIRGPPGPPRQAGSVAPVYLPQDLTMVWFLSLGLSIAAGLYPALKASKLPPIVALRRE